MIIYVFADRFAQKGQELIKHLGLVPETRNLEVKLKILVEHIGTAGACHSRVKAMPWFLVDVLFKPIQ